MELSIATPRAFLPLLQPARYKGAFGGRGSGKSHFFAELLIEEVITTPTRAVCVREVQKSLDQSVKLLLEDKIEALGVGHHFDVLKSHIEVDNGGQIIFQGMQQHTAQSIKSLEGYRIAWIEEAQTLSQYSLDLLRPTIRLPDSEIWASWNPQYPTDPIDTLLRGSDLPPRATVVEVNFNDNPWFGGVLEEEKEFDRRRDPEKYQHIWKGGYLLNSESRVFRNWKVESFETPSDSVFYFGADWGYSVDPSVLVRGFIQGRRLYIDYEAYKVGCEIDHTPALFSQVPRSRDFVIVADSARPETIAYMRRNGFPRMIPAIKGTGSVEEGIEFLRSYDIIVHPRCKHTIDELTLYSYKRDKMTGFILPILEDKKNHVIDATRYMVEPIRKSEYDTSMRWAS